jgi:ABC-2 type transport system permease protein
MSWRVIFAIVRKDVVDAVKNLYVLFAIVMPIVMSLLLRLVFPGADVPGTLTIVVYDPGASRLVAGLRELDQVELLEVASGDRLDEEVEEDAVGGLAVPSGFDAAVEAGEQPDLTVYLNQRRTGYERLVFRRLVEQQVWALAGQDLPARITWTDVAARSGLQGDLDFEHYLLVMFLVMALSMTGAFVVPLLLVEEKEKHTLQALLVSPARPAEVVAGKALTGLFYSLLVSGLLIGLNRGWVGNWPVTILALLLGALFSVEVGLLMGGFFRTTMQVNTWASFVMLGLMAPSWFTIVVLPTPLDQIVRFLPTYYLTQALGLSLAGEASLARVGGHLAVLLGGGMAAFAAVVWTLRREDR